MTAVVEHLEVLFPVFSLSFPLSLFPSIALKYFSNFPHVFFVCFVFYFLVIPAYIVHGSHICEYSFCQEFLISFSYSENLLSNIIF